jgi:hypothetical protein
MKGFVILLTVISVFHHFGYKKKGCVESKFSWMAIKAAFYIL